MSTIPTNPTGSAPAPTYVGPEAGPASVDGSGAKVSGPATSKAPPPLDLLGGAGGSKGLALLGLPPPGGGGDASIAVDDRVDPLALTILLVTVLIDMRKSDRESRDTSLLGQVKELFNSADQTEKAAQSNYQKEMAMGIATAVAGGLQMLGAVGQGVSINRMSAAAKAGNDTGFKIWEQGAGLAQGVGAATSSVSQGGGQIAAASDGKDAGFADAEAKRADARAKQWESVYSRSDQDMGTWKQAMDKVSQLVESIEQSRSETTKRIAGS